MKDEIPSSIKNFLILAICICLSILVCYIIEYNIIYKNIKVKASSIKTLEYGSSNYKVEDLVKNVYGEDIYLKKGINTKKVGIQKAIIIANKNGVSKEIPIKVKVKDTTAPDIKIKEENISLSVGEKFNALNNLKSVSDKVDGNIKYQDNDIVNDKKDTNYYTVYGNVDTYEEGIYPITVKAVDKYGNLSSITYNVEVTEENNDVETVDNREVSDSVNVSAPTRDKSGLVSLAYSLVGSRYVAGGADPSIGFDCSGFVYYLYSSIGISISRSSSTQMYEGVGVSYENAQPGDILSWGYSEGAPTHSAIYVGGGKMIHATNPSMGVVVSDVASWNRGSGTRVIAVRRI